MITYMDRLCIAVAGPSMQKDLGLTTEEWGWVLGAFALTYSLFEIPVGAWGDRFGQKKILTRIVIWWSALTSITGLVQGFRLLVLVRALFGMGEAGAYPNMSGVVVHWFPIKERSRAMGVVWGASRIGGVLSPLIIVPLIAFAGWRQAFWFFGLLGIVWMVIWRKSFHNRPIAQPGITPEELQEINATETNTSHGKFLWKKIFGHSQVWLIMLMYWCYVWGSWFYLSWFHTYLINGRGFTMTEMAVYSPLPFIMGILGNIAGGYLADKCSIKFGIKKGRRLVGSLSLALSACCLLLTAATHGKMIGIVCLALGFGFMDCMLPAAWAICMDIGENHAGAVSGAMNSAGNLGGFVCSIVFGFIVQKSGAYSLAISTVAFFVMISAVLFACINPEHKITTKTEMDLRPTMI
jgi:ACS family glucarate transporter-like MFS transporter